MATRRAKRRFQERNGGRRTIEGWRANGLELRLRGEDLDLLDNVLTVTPILRIVTAIGQEARRGGLKYPVTAAKELQSRLGDKKFRFGDNRVDKDSIARTDSWFPIMHEGEFLSRVHLALLRCEMEAAQLAPRPDLQAR